MSKINKKVYSAIAGTVLTINMVAPAVVSAQELVTSVYSGQEIVVNITSSEVISKIDELPEFDTIDLRHEKQIEYIHELYEALSKDEKEKVTNREKLEQAIEKIEQMKSIPQIEMVESEWSSNRGNINNLGLVDVKLPTGDEYLEEKWKSKGESRWNGGSAIIVEDYLFTARGKKLEKIDRKTGEIVKTVDVPGGIGFYSYPACGDGKIFVPAGNGTIAAFNAKTLELLWTSEKLPEGGQSLSTVTYHDGYVYTGFTNGGSSNSKGGFVAMSTKDDNPLISNEIKDFAWTEITQGYYGAGATIVGQNIVFGGDNGDIFICDRKTGEIKDSKNVEKQIRSAIVNSNGTLYFTASDYLCKLEVNEDGTFGELKKEKLDSESTASPVIYKDNLYIVSGRMISSGGHVYLYNSETLEKVSSVKLPAISQSSPIVTTAYEDKGKIYMYAVTNESNGKLVAVEHDLDTDELNIAFEYSPSVPQYSMLSPVCGKDGTIYFSNDSGNMFAVKDNTIMQDINNTPEIKADNITIKVGEEFDPMKNATANDKEDGDITSSIEIIKNEVNINKEGSYKVVYKVVDSKGASKIKTITVTVKSNEKPVIPPSNGGGSIQKPSIKEEKLIGTTRYETAIEISKKGWDSSDSVVLVNSNAISDALSATPFAKQKDAPILLTEKESLNKQTKEELKRLNIKKAYLIGGEAAISKKIVNELKEMNIVVERISGDDRYETSLKIANQLSNISQIFVANGVNGLADAVSIAPVAASNNIPILLSSPSEGMDGYKEFIEKNKISKSYVIGGNKSISDNVANKLPNNERVYGKNRNETNAAIIDKFYTNNNLTNIYVAKDGMNKESELVDALAVGVLASKNNSPILLAGEDIDNKQEEVLYKKSSKIVTQVGGNGNETVFEKVIKSLKKL